MQARKHNGKTHKTHGNMQPPPRKGKENQQVKLVFSEQLSKLQTKQHQDTELLEEIRSFSKQRASIEKEYGQALQRLAIQHQKRDWQRGTTDAIASGSVFCVWRSLVDATAQIAATRLSAAKEYRKLSGHVSWSLHNAKDIRAKRGLERLQLVQGEVMDALRELHRVKKSYHHLINIAYVAREKAADAQIKFFTYRSCERKIHPICTTSTFLTKPLPTLNARLKECDDRLTEIRNEYLLTVASVNAHQQHYHAHDLPLIMKQMDGDIYDDLRHHFTLLCGTEMDACLTTHKQFSSIWDSVTKVTRERNVQEFLEESISFSKTADFTFQPAPRDKVSTLQDCSTADEEGCLVKEVKKWATKAAKDHKIVAHGERVLQMLESRLQLLSGETGLSVEQKIAEVQESVRKATLGRVKAEARLALLSESVSGTECWLHDAMKQAEEELERERRLSEQRRSTEDFIEDEFELTDFEDYHDDNGDIFAEPVSSFGVYVVPAACRALYSYEAGQSDELSINEGEELQVKDDGDFEDFLKVCNSCGQVGCVPERQVQFLCLPAEDDVPHLNCFIAGNTEGTESRGFVRALYSYQGQSAEELTFQEGAIIRLTRRHGAVDDGFWEGEVDGKIGVFPSLVVELLCDEEEEVQEKDEQEEETHQSPIQSSISALPPISSSPGGSSPGGAAPSGGEETEVEISDLDGNTSEAAVRDQTPAEIPSGRIKPCRAPPPPPAERLSAQR